VRYLTASGYWVRVTTVGHAHRHLYPSLYMVSQEALYLYGICGMPLFWRVSRFTAPFLSRALCYATLDKSPKPFIFSSLLPSSLLPPPSSPPPLSSISYLLQLLAPLRLVLQRCLHGAVSPPRRDQHCRCTYISGRTYEAQIFQVKHQYVC